MRGLSALARFGPASLLVLALVAADQAIKLWVEATLPMHQPVGVAPMLALFRTYNEGVAFSFMAGQSEWFLVAVTAAIALFVVHLWRKTAPAHRLALLGYGLIVGGALGNLIDRAAYGHVVDYILFYTETWSFAVFNLADSFITLGAGAIILDEVFGIGRAKAGTGDTIE